MKNCVLSSILIMFCLANAKVALSQNYIDGNTYYDTDGRAYFYAEDGNAYYYPEAIKVQNRTDNMEPDNDNSDNSALMYTNSESKKPEINTNTGYADDGHTSTSDMQRKFTEIASKYQDLVSTAKNDIQLRLLYKKRTKEFNDLNFNGNVVAWEGTLKRLSTIDDSVFIDIELAPSIEFYCHTNMERSFIDDIAAARIGQKVIFSGKLTPDSDDKGFEEKSFTTKGSLEKPEFEFNLKDIKVVN